MNKDLKYYLTLPYKTVLEYEPDDKTWVAYCPDLGRGTCYAIGQSKSEALELLEKSKKTILEYVIEERKEIPEQTKRSACISMDIASQINSILKKTPSPQK
jgi:predicted RNase H-like HicB family nuclease